MVTGLAARVSVAVVVLGILAGHSVAGDKPKEGDLSRALGQVRLFAGLTDKERSALESAATLRHCKKDERIIEQGKPLDKMFIVLDCPIEIRVNGKLVATNPEPSLVGELEFLDSLPACADVIAVNETRVIELNNAAFADLMKKQPQVGYVLMSEIARIEAQRLRALAQK